MVHQGIDTHDVGGYGPGLPLRSDKPGLKSLRLGRCGGLALRPWLYVVPAFCSVIMEEAVVRQTRVPTLSSSCCMPRELEENMVFTLEPGDFAVADDT